MPRSGTARTATSLREICQAVVIPVQIGGGVRTSRRSRRCSSSGAARAILGTAAALDPAFVARAVEEYAERVLVAVDVRGGHVMVKGWTEEGPELEPTIAALDDAGAPRYLVTAIARDGTLDGPDLRLYKQVLGAHRAAGDRERRRAHRRRHLGAPRRRLRGVGHRQGAVREDAQAVAGDPGLAVLAKRIIPCLDVDAGRVVKGVRFQGLRDAGDPVELAARYDADGRRRARVPRHHCDRRGPRRDGTT